MMNKENRYILLDIINRNGSVNRLTNNGLSYEEIGININSFIKENLIEFKNEKISLTEYGFRLLEELQSEYKKKNKREWIKSYEKGRIVKIEKNFIFVPKQNELTF